MKKTIEAIEEEIKWWKGQRDGSLNDLNIEGRILGLGLALKARRHNIDRKEPEDHVSKEKATKADDIPTKERMMESIDSFRDAILAAPIDDNTEKLLNSCDRSEQSILRGRVEEARHRILMIEEIVKPFNLNKAPVSKEWVKGFVRTVVKDTTKEVGRNAQDWANNYIVSHWNASHRKVEEPRQCSLVKRVEKLEDTVNQPSPDKPVSRRDDMVRAAKEFLKDKNISLFESATIENFLFTNEYESSRPEKPTGHSLPKYRCHKVVRAIKIKKQFPTSFGWVVEGVFDEKYYSVGVTDEYMDKHKPYKGGYYVLYEDGYESFSPAKVFEAGYSRVAEHPPCSIGKKNG